MTPAGGPGSMLVIVVVVVGSGRRSGQLGDDPGRPDDWTEEGGVEGTKPGRWCQQSDDDDAGA